MSLPPFGFVTRHEVPLAEGVQSEAQWMAQCAAGGRAAAHLWRGTPGWSVPRSYRLAPHWAAAQAQWLERGMPIHVRASGGGLVPFGPGLLNLSLVWRSEHDATGPHATEGVYRALCDALAAALARLGLACGAAEVPGAFCDGRFNLAVDGRKIAGTAQAWRRIDGRMIVLAHAVLLTSADPEALTAQANRLEAALGRGAVYRADAVTSIARACAAARRIEATAFDLEQSVEELLAEQFARVVPGKPAAV